MAGILLPSQRRGVTPGRRTRPTSGRPKIVAGAVVLLLVALAGVFANVISPYDPIVHDLENRLAPPSSEHPFGTDDLGRDVFSRTLHAIRIDLAIALVGALIPAVIGSLLGALAALAPRWLGGLIMRAADITQAFPGYVLFVLMAFIFGPGITAFIVGIALISWVSYARIVRTQVLGIRELDYFRAVKASPMSRSRVLFRHVLPNASPQAVVYFASDIVIALLSLSGLSYLGLGIPAPTPEWGSMLAAGQAYIRTAWWLTTFPGLAIVVTGLAFVLLSEGLDDRSRR